MKKWIYIDLRSDSVGGSVAYGFQESFHLSLGLDKPPSSKNFH